MVAFIPGVPSLSPAAAPVPEPGAQPPAPVSRRCDPVLVVSPRTSEGTMRTGGSAYSEPCAAPVGAHREQLPAASRSGGHSVPEEGKAVRGAGGGRAAVTGRALGRGPGPCRLSASVQPRRGGDCVAWGPGDINPFGLATQSGRSMVGSRRRVRTTQGQRNSGGVLLWCARTERETAGAVLRVKAKDKAGLAMRHNQCESWGRERCNSPHWENPAVAVCQCISEPPQCRIWDNNGKIIEGGVVWGESSEARGSRRVE